MRPDNLAALPAFSTAPNEARIQLIDAKIKDAVLTRLMQPALRRIDSDQPIDRLRELRTPISAGSDRHRVRDTRRNRLLIGHLTGEATAQEARTSPMSSPPTKPLESAPPSSLAATEVLLVSACRKARTGACRRRARTLGSHSGPQIAGGNPRVRRVHPGVLSLDNGRRPRNRGTSALAYLPVTLSLLLLAGCQSAPSLPQQSNVGTADDFAWELATSIDTLAGARHTPEALARDQAQHRRLLADRLPELLADATPPRPAAGVSQQDALLDPEDFAQVSAVVRPRSRPAGLERAGVGLPVVARLPAPRDPNAPQAGYHLPATLIAQPVDAPVSTSPSTATDHGGEQGSNSDRRPSGARCCDAALVTADVADQVPTAAGTLPVAMDLLAPLRATKATGVRPIDGIANLVRPGRFTKEPRIIFLRPFEPNKTPVVLVHGLLSTPGIWRPLVTQLLADPRVRDCCQLWFFYYPTGQPVPLSALQLRNALDDVVPKPACNTR